MKTRFLLIAPALAILPVSAQAACYADYKAKQDNPLKLHYGVMKLPQNVCGSRNAAAAAIAPRLAKAGWTLLNVVTLFDEGQLGARKSNAGQYFLRY